MCMRVAGGTPYKCKDGSIGYIYHDGFEALVLPPKPKPAPTINVRSIIADWAAKTTDDWVLRTACRLGVSENSLKDLNIVWASQQQAAAFPMQDGYGNMVGIRLRADNGKKWAVTGSHQGIFIPKSGLAKTVFICEGPTDTAAALSIGLSAVGRPSCSGGMPDIIAAFRRLSVSKAIIITDNDDPGITGAMMLSRQLRIPHCTIILPCKDVRSFVNNGGSAATMRDLVNDSVWVNP